MLERSPGSGGQGSSVFPLHSVRFLESTDYKIQGDRFMSPVHPEPPSWSSAERQGHNRKQRVRQKARRAVRKERTRTEDSSLKSCTSLGRTLALSRKVEYVLQGSSEEQCIARGMGYQ